MDEKRRKSGPRAPRKIDLRYLENAALYYLQRYATSSANLKNVLGRKIARGCAHHGQDPAPFVAALDQLVARYQQTGLLNDIVYAEGRVQALRRQGLSRQAIRQKLSLKGLGPAEIDHALQQIDATASDDSRDAELAAARTLARRKKIGPWRRAPLADPRDGQKELAAMARAGFSYDIARQALDAPDGGDGDEF